MNNPFDYTPSRECREAFVRLLGRLETLRESHGEEDRKIWRELEAGKMLGVLIAEDGHGERHALYAFSGQLGDKGFSHPWFVEAVFDYLRPDGYFKTREAAISMESREIAAFETGEMRRIENEYDEAKRLMEGRVMEAKEKFRQSKTIRDERRASGVTAEEEAEMIRQSQYEKAELRRIRKREEQTLAPSASRLEEARERLRAMRDNRRMNSELLQKWLFDNFMLFNARGESRSLSEIFAPTPLGVPPSGAGECCGPKLLQAAFRRGWQPVSMAEYWYGRPKGGEVRRHGEHYPACRGKCLPVLEWMLEGLEVKPPLSTGRLAAASGEPKIIFENRWFCVVDKPSGMLSVPGKGKAVSVQRWLEERYGGERRVKVAHRLDQDTSGLLTAAFGDEAFKTLQRMFALRRIRKEYVAVLDGDYASAGLPAKGEISLPLSADWLDRPRQRVDFETGKEALTEYEFVGVREGCSRIIFRPHTGRTHQLRVHSASAEGLGIPIAGDPLYGRNGGAGASRLMLHAGRLEFQFPLDGNSYVFESPAPF